MGKFLKGNQLNAELEKLFDEAQKFIVIISPYIKLHPRFIDSIKSKIDDDNFEFIIVFGKNEDDLTKSLNQQDFEFLKAFPNIQIRHESRLHAKYYSNETTAILSSMNLYDFSQNNNIEFGILTKTGKLISDPLDTEAYNYFDKVIENSQLMFHCEPKYESQMLGLSSKYIGSDITLDNLSPVFDKKANSNTASPKSVSSQNGFCIRTGISIPFNPKRPLSDKAYKSWSQYSDENYAEKYCHYSGEKSNGETCFARPILKKNWNEAKKRIR